MPATAVPVTTSSINGTVWPATDGVAADIVNKNNCPNGPNVMVICTNTVASAATVTFTTPYTAGGLAIAEDLKNLLASERKVFGPFPVNIYGDVLEFLASAVTVKFIVLQHT